jgi:hypothetical protein
VLRPCQAGHVRLCCRRGGQDFCCLVPQRRKHFHPTLYAAGCAREHGGVVRAVSSTRTKEGDTVSLLDGEGPSPLLFQDSYHLRLYLTQSPPLYHIVPSSVTLSILPYRVTAGKRRSSLSTASNTAL